MPEPPVDYLEESINVDPDLVFADMWRIVNGYGAAIAGAIENIIKIWDELKLGWAGKTADEAKAFSTQWANAISGLFGSPKDQTVGTLGQLANAVNGAQMNYSRTEWALINMFNQFSNGLTQSTGGGPAAPGAHNVTAPPIIETGK